MRLSPSPVKRRVGRPRKLTDEQKAERAAQQRQAREDADSLQRDRDAAVQPQSGGFRVREDGQYATEIIRVSPEVKFHLIRCFRVAGDTFDRVLRRELRLK